MSDHTHVIWLDPGETTGYATYTMHDGEFMSGQLPFHGVGRMLTTYSDMWGVKLAVGYERFIVTDQGSKYASPEWPLKVCGMVDWLTELHGFTALPSMPSSARNLGRDGNKLQRLGWWTPGRVHANDAAAHLLAWLLRSGKLPIHQVNKLFTDTPTAGKIKPARQ